MRRFSIALMLLGCGGNLDVGAPPGTDGGPVVGVGTCAPSDCAGYSLSCSSGQPTGLQCVPDSAIMGCTLTGQCTDPSATQTCTYTAPSSCTGSGPCAMLSPSNNTGEIDLSTDPVAMKTTLAVYLGGSTSQTIGACSYQPYGIQPPGYEVGQPMPNEGTVTATSTGFSLADSPLCDGSYPTASTGQLLSQGAVVSFDWTGATGESKPMFPSIPGPHAISVTEPGTLDATGTTLSRGSDATLTWTSLEAPLSLEQVGIELLQGSKRIECLYTASAGTGTVPADALLVLASGPAQFRMYSLHASPATGGFTTPTFRVLRDATFSDGPVVQGTLTLQ